MASQNAEGNGIEHDHIIHGDCIEELRKLDKNSVEAVVTDPPYGIAFMSKDWDEFEPKEYQTFCEKWGREVRRVLKPGGFLLAFSGTRTYHRMVTGLQDAGFEIRDMINWMYGQGFPKSYNFDRFDESWEGWGTALKPAHEPIVLAQNPREGTYENNVKQYNCGGLNIDGCRIGTGEGGGRQGEQSRNRRYTDNGSTNIAAQPGSRGGAENGRWPANVILDPVAANKLDAQTGELNSGVLNEDHNIQSRMAQHCYGEYERSQLSDTYGDSGGASRFFYCAKAHKSERNAGLADVESKKFGQSGGAQSAIEQGEDYDEGDGIGLNDVKEVKNDIATLKPINLMRYLVRLVTPPNGTVLDPFAGSGTTGCACEVEQLDYLLIEKRAKFAKEIMPRRLKYWAEPENWDDLKDHNALNDPAEGDTTD